MPDHGCKCVCWSCSQRTGVQCSSHLLHLMRVTFSRPSTSLVSWMNRSESHSGPTAWTWNGKKGLYLQMNTGNICNRWFRLQAGAKKVHHKLCYPQTAAPTSLIHLYMCVLLWLLLFILFIFIYIFNLCCCAEQLSPAGLREVYSRGSGCRCKQQHWLCSPLHGHCIHSQRCSRAAQGTQGQTSHSTRSLFKWSNWCYKQRHRGPVSIKGSRENLIALLRVG